MGFLHHFTERAGVGQLAFARYAGGFDVTRSPRPLPSTLLVTWTPQAVSLSARAIIKALHHRGVVQIIAVNFDMF